MGFWVRIRRAALLDASVYEEVEADPRSIIQAAAVVLFASLAGGLGAGWPHARNIVLGTLVTLAAWLVWAVLSYAIGTRLLPEPQTRTDMGEMLRTIGFANAPGMFRILGLFSSARSFVFILTGIWVLAATIVAVRQALDYRSTPRAVAVCGIGWVLQIAILIFGFTFLSITSGPAY